MARIVAIQSGSPPSIGTSTSSVCPVSLRVRSSTYPVELLPLRRVEVYRLVRHYHDNAHLWAMTGPDINDVAKANQFAVALLHGLRNRSVQVPILQSAA